MKNLMNIVMGTIIFFSLESCNKLSKNIEATPIDFDGLERIQASAGGSFVLSWTIPRLVDVENYGVYIQALDATQAKEQKLVAATTATASSDSLGNIVSVTAGSDPAAKGQLISLVAGTESSFKTPSLDEGYYLFQVHALTKDGRADTNVSVRILQVLASDAFGGLAIAAVEGTNVRLSWLPSPTLREDENYQYTVYKGPAFNNAIGYTKKNEYVYSLNSEAAGDTIYFGVRLTDGQGNEDRNAIIIPVKIPDFNKDFQGCLTAQGVGSDRIRIDFEWPSTNYSELKVFRNQREVFTSFDKKVSSFIDRGLVEGDVYTYTCQALEGGLVLAGTNAVKASTLNTNPPTFSGIKNVSAKDGHTAILSWGVSTGVPADVYKLYASNGNALNWTDIEKTSATASTLTGTITGLGDDLVYSFGVRSCGGVACDANTEQLTITMPDAGAPLSVGVTNVLLENGKIKLTAPWKTTDGGVAKRNVYLKTDGLASQVIADYVLIKTVVVPSSGVVPTEITLDGLAPNKTYHIIVRDEDSHGQINQNTAVVSVTTGDLTPPDFNGIVSLAVGATGAEETSLVATFAAIAPHTTEIKGAKTYRFYVREGSIASSCAETYYSFSLEGADFAAGNRTTTITGLKPKTVYSVCVKVVDKFNNISVNDNFTTRQTLDKTKPDFDGIQTLTFDPVKSEVTVSWNPSSSSDVYEYKMTAWLKSHNSGTEVEIPISRRVTESPSSYTFDNHVVTFESEDELELIVNACDNAGAINGGSQNCSTFTRTTSLKLIFEDILPPQGFLGIAALGSQENTVPGIIGVHWIPPNSWIDYSGFKIYSVDGTNLTLMKDCPCVDRDCPNQISTCNLTDLSHFRSYRLHVRAYDARGNLTLLDTSSNTVEIRTIDTEKPVFTSNLALTFATGTSSLDWAIATDDQYPTEPGAVITYQVYRKVDSNFSNLLNPANDGILLGETTDHVWADSGNFISGKTYYYTVCASDASGNKNCDGTFKTATIPDLLPPKITSFTSNKTETGKTWGLTWAATDNITVGGDLIYRIKSRASADPAAILDDSDNTIFTQIGTTTTSGLIGPINQNIYIHYLLTVTDGAGNKVSKQITVYSQNKVVVSTVRSTEGTTAGNKLVYMVGEGFHSSSVVTIGGSTCTSLQLISSKHLLCKTPAKAIGTYAATVTNSDGSSGSLANAYSYCTPNVNCSNICNNPSSWEATFAKQTGRGASLALPFVLCNGTHLANIAAQNSGKFFVLGDNIDLSGYSTNNWVPIKSANKTDTFASSFDGGGHALTNLTFNNAAFATEFGIFRRIGTGAKIFDLGLLNMNITAGNVTGALAGGSDTDVNIIVQDIVVQGVINGGTNTGGMAGACRGSVYRVYVAADVTGGNRLGGVCGSKTYGGTDITFVGNVTSTAPSGNEYRAGGIFGELDGNAGTISGLYAKATVTTTIGGDKYRTGGLIGSIANETVSNSTFEGTVVCNWECGGAIGITDSATTLDNVTVKGSVTGVHEIGGMIGNARNLVTFNNVNNEANVTGQYNIGGIAGRADGGSNDITIKLGSRNSGTISSNSNNDNIGGLIGLGYRTIIQNSYNTGIVTGRGLVGGLIGRYDQNVRGLVITNSYNTGAITGTQDHVGGAIGWSHSDSYSPDHLVTGSFNTGKIMGRSRVGGICGTCQGTYKTSYSTGDVEGTGEGIGGFAGWTERSHATQISLFEDSYATGNVKASTTSQQFIGGFVGLVFNRVKFNRSYATGTVVGFNEVGGFLGRSHDIKITVDRCYSTGHVEGNGDFTGGFGGRIGAQATIADHVITNSYSRSTVSGNSFVGGFAGYIFGTVSNSYATGKIEQIVSNRDFAGFVGNMHSSSSMSNNLWDKTTTGETTSSGAVGKTTTEMKTITTWSAFNGTTIWSIKAGSYPRLLWEPGATP